MLVLDVFHNKTFIKSAEKEDLDLVKKALTVFKKKYQTSQFQESEWEVTFLLSYKDFSFPSAYLKEVKAFCDEQNIQYHLTDSRKYPYHTKPKLVSKIDLPLREDQKEAYFQIQDNNRGIIMMPTATGKSRVIAKTIEYRKVRTMVIVPKQNLQDQLTQLLQKCFGKSRVDMQMPWELKEKMRVGLVRDEYEQVDENHALRRKKISLDPELMKSNKKEESDEKKPSLMDELLKPNIKKTKFSLNMDAIGKEAEPEAPEQAYLKDKTKQKIIKQAERKKQREIEKRAKPKEIKYKDIYVFCDASLSRMPQEFLDQFEMVIVDECHHASSKTIREALLKMKNAAFRYYFSATPWRDHKADQKLLAASIGSDIIYELSPEDAVNLESIARPDYKQKESPQPKQFMKDKKRWREVLEFGIIGNETRNARIVEDALADLDAGNNVFIAVDEISHLEILKERFRVKGTVVDVIHGEMPRNESREIINKVGERESGICIGTMSVGEGTDMPNITSVILASGGKSSIRLLQRIGRGARKGTEQNKTTFKVTDYLDWFHTTLLRHSMKRKEVFNNYFKLEFDAET